MPKKHIGAPARDQEAGVREALIQEWKEPNPNSQEPLIVTEGGNEGSPRRVYVVWSAWSDLDQATRSGIIMDAAEAVLGKNVAVAITVAMGLTVEEAKAWNMDRALGLE